MNKYEIIGIVGEGAYGVVYKAKCKESGDFGKYTSPIYVFLLAILTLFFDNYYLISNIYIYSCHQEIQRV